jgi:hypothetical protein
MIAEDELELPEVDFSSGLEMAQQLVRMRHAIDVQELAFSKVAAEFAASNYYDHDGGAINAVDWMRLNCHMTSNAVADRVSVGSRIGDLVRSVAQVAFGEIGFAHLVVIARTAKAVGEAFDERALLERAGKCSPGKLHHESLQYRHSVQPKEYAAEQAEQAEWNRLSLSTCEDGSLLINGVLDTVGGAAVRSALEPLARLQGKHDHRLRDQRMADALVELATHGGKQKVQLQVTSSIETLLGLVGATGADMEFSLPVSSKTVERWACDCSVTRVLMQDSVVIDVGRAKRVISGPARRALDARDQHCVWPGCERPASWSDGHHIVHWIQGGTSDLANLALLCHRHHRMVHEGDWQIVKTDEGRIVPIPPRVTFGQYPRGPD